jgi:proline iminopeptidase
MMADADAAVVERAVQAWCRWEDTHTSLAPDFEPYYTVMEPQKQQTVSRLVTHYWGNGCFLDEAPVLANMHRIAHLPGFLIHGRYDVSGPLETAWDLHRAWPGSELVAIGGDGHFGAGVTAAWIEALDKVAVGANQT